MKASWQKWGKKRMKRILLLLMVLVLLVSCSRSNTIKYPPKLKMSDYTPCDYNLLWLQKYENGCFFPYYRYYGIVDVPTTEFLAHVELEAPRGQYIPVVYMCKSAPVSPLDDWEIDYAEFLSTRLSFNRISDTLYWNQVGQAYVGRLCGQVDLDIIEQVIDLIKEYRSSSDQIKFEDNFKVRSIEDVSDGMPEYYKLSLRIHFTQFANIVMDLRLFEYEGEFYFYYKTNKLQRRVNRIAIPVPEELKMAILDLIANHGFMYRASGANAGLYSE